MAVPRCAFCEMPAHKATWQKHLQDYATRVLKGAASVVENLGWRLGISPSAGAREQLAGQPGHCCLSLRRLENCCIFAAGLMMRVL